MANLKLDQWSRELEKKFRPDVDFLQFLRNYDSSVNADNIIFAQPGADPDVLIDHDFSTPLTAAARTDTPIIRSLKHFTTTVLTSQIQETHGLPYGKNASLMEDIKSALERAVKRYTAHGLAPAIAGGSAAAPVLLTSGASDGESVQPRRVATIADIIALKKAFDLADVPQENRHLLMHPRHWAELLAQDVALFKAFANHNSGEPVPLYGFSIHVYTDTPVYFADSGNSDTITRRAYGAAAAAADLIASVAFYGPRGFRAKGGIGMAHSKMEDNPRTQQDEFAGYLWFDGGALQQNGIGALVSNPTVA